MVLFLATNPSPCLQHSWKQILVKLWCCSWQQILRHAFKFLKAISYQTTTVHSLSSFPQIVAEISLQSSLVKDWSNVVFL
jgi:hypothetical protein